MQCSTVSCLSTFMQSAAIYFQYFLFLLVSESTTFIPPPLPALSAPAQVESYNFLLMIVQLTLTAQTPPQALPAAHISRRSFAQDRRLATCNLQPPPTRRPDTRDQPIESFTNFFGYVISFLITPPSVALIAFDPAAINNQFPFLCRDSID